jgi:iron complex outermembrane receptor protein
MSFKAALLTGALGLTAGAPVLAQTSAPSPAPQPDNTGVAEVVVTAQRRAESVQNVPISITAINGATLSQAGIEDTEQLSTLTPGLLVQRSVVGKISIRGVGNENYTIAGDPGVAVHSDGVYVARAAAGLFDLYDIDRVEVLRGPQGTLYGRNATGGVINVIPATPSSQYGGYMEGELGNYNERRFDGAVNLPLNNDFAFRIAALGNWRDGFTKNTNADAISRGFGDFDDKDVWAVRAQLAKVSPGPFTARLLFEDINDNSNLPAYKYLNQPNALPNADFGGFGPGSLRTVDQGIELAIPGSGHSVGTDSDVFKTHQLGTDLHLGYDFGSVKLTSITGYRHTDFNYFDDGDGSNVFYVNYIQQDRSNQFSQEVQLSGGFGRFDWLLGGYYFRESGDTFIALPFTLGLDLPFYITSIGSANTQAEAGFGELRWQPIDRLKITIGGRYSNEDRKADYVYTVVLGPPVIENENLKANFGAFTPRFVADYQLYSDVSLYASATRGFKSGGFNLLAAQPGFEPEKVWAYEVGTKSQFFERRLTFNADAFYYDYRDIQVGQIVNLSSVLTNAAAATVKGVEAELSAHPTQALTFGATFAYLDAVYDKFCTGDPTKPTYGTADGPANGLPATPDPGCSAANPINLKGNTFPRAPKYTVTGMASYTVPLEGHGSLTLRGDIRYQSLTYFSQFNRPLISQPGYTLVNSRLIWTAPDHRTQVSLFVENLFNKTYFSEVLESGAFNPQLVGQAYVAPPRTFGINASYTF